MHANGEGFVYVGLGTRGGYRLLLAEQLGLVQLLDDAEQCRSGLEHQPLLRQLEHQLLGAVLLWEVYPDYLELEVTRPRR